MSEINWNSIDLGPIDAYAEAVEAGYTGTREEWLLEVGSVKEHAEAAEDSAEAAEDSAEAAAGSATSAAASAAEAAQYTSTAVHTWLENNIDPDSGYALDRTLSEPLEAAPADLVGDLKSALFNIAEYETTIGSWEQGTFEPFGCGRYAADNVIRSMEFLGVKNCDMSVRALTGYTLRIFAFDSTDTYIGQLKTSGQFVKNSGNVATPTEFDFNKYPDYTFHVCLVKSDTSNITPSDSNNLVVAKSLPKKNRNDIAENRSLIENMESSNNYSNATIHEIFAEYGIDNSYKLNISSSDIATAASNGLTLKQISDTEFSLNGTATGAFNINVFKTMPVSGDIYYDITCTDATVNSSDIYLNIGYFDESGTAHDGLSNVYVESAIKKITYPSEARLNRDWFRVVSGGSFSNAVFNVLTRKNKETVFDTIKDPEGLYNFAALSLGYQSYIEYDTVNETLTIPRDIAYYGKNVNGNDDYKALNASEPYVISNVNYNTIGSSNAKLVLDPSNWTFSIIKYDTKNNGKKLVACLRLKAGNFPGGLVTPYPWKIDGKPYGIDIPPFTYETDSVVKTSAHRGWVTKPENTIIAFKEARKQGCLRVETDVQFTADGTPVLMHDETINRTCCNASDGSSLGDTPIYVSSIADSELEDYDACTPSVWNTFKGTKIPTLEEFCQLCREIGLKPDIELKTDAYLTEEKVQTIIGIVAKYGLTSVARYPSTSSTYLTYVKNNSPTSDLMLILFDTVTDANITTMQGLKTGYNTVWVSLYAQSTSYPTDSDVNKCIAAWIPMQGSGAIAENATRIINANQYITEFSTGNVVVGKALYNHGIS